MGKVPSLSILYVLQKMRLSMAARPVLIRSPPPNSYGRLLGTHVKVMDGTVYLFFSASEFDERCDWSVPEFSSLIR